MVLGQFAQDEECGKENDGLNQHGQRHRGDQGKLNGLVIEFWHGVALAQGFCGLKQKLSSTLPGKKRRCIRSRRRSLFDPALARGAGRNGAAA